MASGGETVTERGVVYSISDVTPTIGEMGVTQDANGSGTGSFSESITGLSTATTYNVRAYATNNVGTSYGSMVNFTTSAVAPTATTIDASSISSTSATLNGTVNANNATAVVTFEYGTSTSYGSIGTAAQSPVTGTSTTAVSYSSTGLTPNTTYHFRVKSNNSAGTTYGSDMTFSTDVTSPTLSATSASSVTATAATLNFTSDEAGTYYYLVYAASNSAPNAVTVKAQGSAVAAGFGGAAASVNTVGMTGLSASTDYKAYVIVEDAVGNKSAVSTIDITTSAAPDTTAPTIIGRIPPVSKTYVSGEELEFKASFSELVSVTGTPYLSLEIGSANVEASYISGSGTTVLIFRYAVKVGDFDTDDISNGAIILNGGTIKDTAGNNAVLSVQTGALPGVKVDAAAPIAGDSGSITSSGVSQTGITLSWNKSTDTTSTQTALQYLVYQSSSNNLDNVINIEANGTAVGSYTSDISAKTVSNLTAGTTYYFNVIVKDEAGNKTCYTAKSVTTTTATDGGGSSGSSSSSSGSAANNSAAVIVNGESKTAGTSQTTTNSSGQTVTTVTVDSKKLENILTSESSGSTVTIPIMGNSDVATGTLTGTMVKSMENKDATLIVQTISGTYTIPASEINIDALSQQLGTNVSLSDINVTITISEPSASMTQIVENAAKGSGFTIIVPAVEYTITCTHSSQTVNLSSFNAYVERTIAIPSDVDPAKITTGIVIKPDGTTHHVPTRVKVINGKYYAVINSLTNSTYSVVWNPIEFTDVAKHWAKDAINDIGSRMIVTGVKNNNYAPDRNMTRAEFATIMVKALGLEPATGVSSFGDVAANDWYSGYIKVAASYGIINGYDNGNFGPNDTITREQAMTTIMRVMKIMGLDAGLTDSEVGKLLSTFSDGTSASTYAKYSIAACLKTGISSGTSDTTISPKADITRAEVAVMIQRLLQKSEMI